MARHMLRDVVRIICGNEDICAICLGTPKDLCYLGCGHGFCRECLDNWTAQWETTMPHVSEAYMFFPLVLSY